MRNLAKALTLVLCSSSAALSADWLGDAVHLAAHPDATQAAPASDAWIPFTPQSRLFSGEIPATGWWPIEQDTAHGPVFMLLGRDSPSGTLRATLSVRFYDRDTLGFTPVKQAVDAMRREDSALRRTVTPARPLRVGLGLARTFEVVQTRRLPAEEGPSTLEEIHQYVAVIPVGEAYYLVRLTSPRANYLDYRDDFVRFLKSMRATFGR